MERLSVGVMRRLPVKEKIVQHSMPITETGCWIWLGGVTKSGYGVLSGTTVHRIAYESFVSPIPAGAEIDHICNVRCCVNPAHLRAVSHADNMLAARERRLVCAAGHMLQGENLGISPGEKPGWTVKRCRECHRIRQRRRYARIKGLVTDDEGYVCR